MNKKIVSSSELTKKFLEAIEKCTVGYQFTTFAPIKEFSEEDIIKVLQDPYWNNKSDKEYIDWKISNFLNYAYSYKYYKLTSIFEKYTTGRLLICTLRYSNNKELFKKCLESDIIKVRDSAIKYCNSELLLDIYQKETSKQVKNNIRNRIINIANADFIVENTEVLQFIIKNFKDFGYYLAAKSAFKLKDNTALRMLINDMREAEVDFTIYSAKKYDIIKAIRIAILELDIKDYLYNIDFIQKISDSSLSSILEIKLSMQDLNIGP